MVKMDEAVFWARLHATLYHDSAATPVFLIMLSDITEHRQAVEALRASELRESENRFRRLFRRHSAVMLILDAESGSIIDANKAAVRFYGWPVEELKRMRIHQLSTLPPEAVRADMSQAALVKGTGIEFRHRRADGSIRDVEVFSNKIESAGKELLFSIIHDISERKQAEEDREASVELLRITNESRGAGELIQAATDCFRKHSGCEEVRIRLNEEDAPSGYDTRGFPGEFVPAGKRRCASEQTGAPRSGTVSRPGFDCLCDNVICGRFDSSQPFFTANGSFWSNCVTDLPATISRAALQACSQGCWNDGGYESAALIPLRIGTECLGLLQFKGRRKGCFSPEAIALLERLAGYLAAALAKVRADEGLRRAKEEWERTFDSVPDLITILDNQHRVLRVNMATARRLGVKPEDCVGLHCYQVVHGTSRPPRSCPHTRTIADGCEHAEEVHEERLGGDFLVTTSPLVDETGERVGSVHIAHDITERKRNEEVIRRRAEDLRISNEELTRITRAVGGPRTADDRVEAGNQRTLRGDRPADSLYDRFSGGRMLSDTAGSAVQLSRAERLLPCMLFALAACGLYAINLYSYLLFHTLIEISCIFVTLSVFFLAWNSRRLLDNHAFLFLAISFLSSGALELFHTLAYKGFGIFPGHDANLPTQLWAAFRYVFSLSFLAAPVFSSRKLNAAATLAAYAVITAVLFAAIFSGNFPDCFIEGQGLTPFKIVSEYLIIAILLAAIGLLVKKRAQFDPRILRTLIGSIVSAIAAEVAFTQYLSVYGPANLVGHLFLFLSALLIYNAVVVTGIKEPAALLFHNLELSQEALKNSEERLRFTLETCHIGAWDFDLLDQTAYRSLEHDRIFGYPELLPKWTLELFLQHALPEYRAEVETLVREATAAHTGGTYECRIRRADGEIRWIWLSGRHRTDRSGRSRVAGIVQDITERKLAEESFRETAVELQAANNELDKSRHVAINLLDDALDARRQAEEVAAALQESEERFRTLADAIPQLCWMANAEGLVFWYNRRWYEYTGTTPEQMKGWGWQTVHDPRVLPEVIDGSRFRPAGLSI